MSNHQWSTAIINEHNNMISVSKYFNLPVESLTPAIEEEFFSSIRLRNGTYKTTFQKRFTDINKQIISLLKDTFIKVDNILDIGISSGISTLELFEELSAAGYTSHIVGTDMLINAYIVRVFPGCSALVDDKSYPLRFHFFNWDMKPWIISKDYYNGYFIFRKIVNLVFTSRAKSLIDRSKSKNIQQVKLITPKLRGHSNINIQLDDITDYNHSYKGKYNFIRAANILNVNYFTQPELTAIIGNIKRYITKPYGTLLVVRTHEDGSNHGTLFNIEDNRRCEIIKRFGNGSEIEDIVLGSMSEQWQINS